MSKEERKIDGITFVVQISSDGTLITDYRGFKPIITPALGDYPYNSGVHYKKLKQLTEKLKAKTE